MISPDLKKNFLSVILVLSACGLVLWIIYQYPTKLLPNPKIPDTSWERVFFGEINNVAELASLKDLRKTKFDGDDVEIRIWRGFGLSDLEGIAVKRIKNEWSGVHIKSNNYTDATSAKVV
jgi:hypothetical protein